MRGDARVPYPLGVSQNFATGAASARTAAGVGSQTRSVIVSCDQACYYALGDASVTATASNTFLPANSEHYIRIRPGQYVAAIQLTTAGTFHVSEMDG